MSIALDRPVSEAVVMRVVPCLGSVDVFIPAALVSSVPGDGVIRRRTLRELHFDDGDELPVGWRRAPGPVFYTGAAVRLCRPVRIYPPAETVDGVGAGLVALDRNAMRWQYVCHVQVYEQTQDGAAVETHYVALVAAGETRR